MVEKWNGKTVEKERGPFGKVPSKIGAGRTSRAPALQKCVW